MKKFFLTVLAAGMTTLSFSQKTFILSHQDRKGFFAVSAGASLPIGKFGSISSVDERAGFAKQGVALNISAGYRIAGPVGLMIRGEQHRNAVNTKAMLDGLYRNETDVWTAKADNWSVTSVMAGPYINIPMGLFSLDAHALAGRAMAVLPGTAMSGNFGREQLAVERTGSNSTATAFGGGVALRYRFSRTFSLHVSGDYTRAQFQFDNLTSTVWNDNGRARQPATAATGPLVSSACRQASVFCSGMYTVRSSDRSIDLLTIHPHSIVTVPTFR